MNTNIQGDFQIRIRVTLIREFVLYIFFAIAQPSEHITVLLAPEEIPDKRTIRAAKEKLVCDLNMSTVIGLNSSGNLDRNFFV